MKNRLSTQPKLTPKQIKALGEVNALISELHERLTVRALGEIAGVDNQLISYHAVKYRKNIKAEKGENK